MSLLFALCSNISFASASLYFTKYGHRMGAAWMNFVKAAVAFIAFCIVNLVVGSSFSMGGQSVGFLVFSGLVGLTLGDIFLIRAFTELGSGRVLMIFGFEPVILGVCGFLLFDEKLAVHQILAIFFLVACLVAFAMESKKQKGHWGIRGLSFALIGVSLDVAGLVLTKKAMTLSPQMNVFEVNLIRSGVTVLAFLIWAMVPRSGFAVLPKFRQLLVREKIEVLLASFFGTFLSLSFYMKAVQIGPVATVSAVAGTSPLIATLVETFRGHRKATWPLAVAVICFLLGLFLLIAGPEQFQS